MHSIAPLIIVQIRGRATSSYNRKPRHDNQRLPPRENSHVHCYGYVTLHTTSIQKSFDIRIREREDKKGIHAPLARRPAVLLFFPLVYFYCFLVTLLPHPFSLCIIVWLMYG